MKHTRRINRFGIKKFNEYQDGCKLRLAESRVNYFNFRFPVGKIMVVTLPDGEKVVTRVKAPATIFGHDAIAWFEGIIGGYIIIQNRLSYYGQIRHKDARWLIEKINLKESLKVQKYQTNMRLIAARDSARDAGEVLAPGVLHGRQTKSIETYSHYFGETRERSLKNTKIRRDAKDTKFLVAWGFAETTQTANEKGE